MKYNIQINDATLIKRPGYFGSKRDKIINELNEKYGKGKWQLYWFVESHPDTGKPIALTYEDACKQFYERSYLRYLSDNPQLVDEICQYKECFDNDTTNVNSGLDYTIQEAYSTHIQDIAVRNVLHKLGKKFLGTKNELLQIRSSASRGYFIGPGNVPFFAPETIIKPSKCPDWAHENSVEDFWQSNKFIGIPDAAAIYMV